MGKNPYPQGLRPETEVRGVEVGDVAVGADPVMRATNASDSHEPTRLENEMTRRT